MLNSELNAIEDSCITEKNVHALLRPLAEGCDSDWLNQPKLINT